MYKPVDFNPFRQKDFHTKSNENTLLGYLEKQAIENSSRMALSFYSKRLNYHELHKSTNQLAHFLIGHNIEPGDTIGIILNRSTEMIIALLAVLKCGATFVPIDPHFPKDRVLYMLEDSKVKMILTNKEFESQYLIGAKEIIIEKIWKSLQDYSSETPSININGNFLAYILYTSGSTGNPKGVQIRHSNLLNFLLSMQKSPGIQPNDKIMASTTISFDISILEIFLPLISGAQIVLIDEDIRRSAKLILDTIRKEKISIMQAGPALFKIMLYEDWKEKLPIKLLCGGEPLPKDLAISLLKKSNEVWNMYGPTETTVWSTIKKLSLDDELITIGKPIDNTEVYILDEELNQLADGQEGEIYIAGEGLALGYLNRLDLTAKKFIKNPFSNDATSLIYGTGDMGMILPNGEIQCFGRLDHQIKIDGVRIELGEIEQKLLLQEGVKEASVIVREDENEAKNLYAYIVPTNKWEDSIEKEYKIKWREELKKTLPLSMIPHSFILLPVFPMTPNGKIDRKSFPKPIVKRPELSTLYLAPKTDIEKKIASVWTSLLRIEQLGVDDSFFDLGGNSLLAVKVIAEFKKLHNYAISITQLYQFPTIKALASLIEKRENTEKRRNKHKASAHIAKPNEEIHKQDIAVIGMAGRFPGAGNINELWTLLKEGKEGVSFFSSEELDISIPEEDRNDPDYVPARGIISGIEDFDSGFFGINPRLAELMDPQQRIFLEICWEVLEESGYTDQHYSGSIGVFAGCSNESYFINNVQHHKRLIKNMGAFQVKVVNEKDYISSRVSYALNLKGPAITIQSACSTSLLTIAQAVESLRSGHCDMALAGGVSVLSPVKSGHVYQEGSMQSADGHCRPFDSEATGTIFSDGAGIVLLKPLKAAQKDGDTIYAVVKGIGLNNDGAGKGSFTAPSSDGQSKAIKMALEDANFDPLTISYIEAHGTATPLGDPIELEGLKQAFNIENEKQFCAIGSIKSNLGHANTAAGVFSFIKTCLAIHHQQIPPSINFFKPNPHIDFEDSPFYVNTYLTNWALNEFSETRRAGVSSFGVGGTNVHITLEEAEQFTLNQLTDRPYYLINWSAKNETSLDLYREKLLLYLEKQTDVRLIDLAYSLQNTRSDFHFRQFLITSSKEDLIEQLRINSSASQIHNIKEQVEEVVFVFPGQGSQYLNMGKDLYLNEGIFKAAIDECVPILEEFLSENILDVIFPEEDSEKAKERLNNTYYTQPALFIIEYALARLIMSWGIQPAAFLGHSIGEFVGAHLAGVFSLRDGLYLIAMRGKLMTNLASGSMLAIRAKHKEITAILPHNLCIAAINSPGLCVVAGPDSEILDFTKSLEQQFIASTPLHTSHAFHSSMMDEIVEPFENIIRAVKLQKPKIPIVSTVTGTWMTDAEAQDPHYWASHLRKPVNFLEASNTLLSDKKRFIVECGPRNVLSSLIKQQGFKGVLCSATLQRQNGASENSNILNTLGQLWLNGIAIDWKSYYANQKYPRIKLPSYAFDKKRCWVDPIPHKAISEDSRVESLVP